MIQTMLIDPGAHQEALAMSWQSLKLLRASFENAEVLAGLATVSSALTESRPFDALKVVRALLPVEAEIMAGHPATPGSKLEMIA
jgi:flagellar protein FlbT